MRISLLDAACFKVNAACWISLTALGDAKDFLKSRRHLIPSGALAGDPLCPQRASTMVSDR